MTQAKLLKQHRYIMHKLAKSDIATRRAILKNAPSQLFKALNVVFKLLNEDKVNLPSKQSGNIKKHKQLIKSISRLRGADIKGKLMRQRGGALGTILTAILPVIGKLLKGIFLKNDAISIIT